MYYPTLCEADLVSELRLAKAFSDLLLSVEQLCMDWDLSVSGDGIINIKKSSKPICK